jgi:hypothetical protein
MPDIAQTWRRFGFSAGTEAAPITGAPAAYCFDIHQTQSLGHWRNTMVTLWEDKSTIRLRPASTGRLSAPEHHRYVRFLDWKVSRECEKGGCGGGEDCL